MKKLYFTSNLTGLTNTSKPNGGSAVYNITACTYYYLLKRYGFILFLLAFLFFSSRSLFAQTIGTTTYSGAGTYTWTCPSGVTTVTVQAWGGGGGGGGVATINNAASGGGAGGSYNSTIYTVTSATSYNVTVGAGGAGGLNTGTNGSTGGSSTFDGTNIIAVGGPGGTGATTAGGAAGGTGTTTGNTAGTNFAGGNGAIGVTTADGGGGGGGAGNSAVGGNAGVAPAAGAGGVAGGGVGGTGASGAVGAAGTTPGGGGGGTRRNGANETGGAGGAGQVIVSYINPLPAIDSFPNQTFCAATFTTPTAYNTVNFSLIENAETNFDANQTNQTLILTLPAGFQFNTTAGTVTRNTAAPGQDITIGAVTITTTSVTVNLTTAATQNNIDEINFNGFQIRATAAPSSGTLIRTGGTFKINGSTGIPAASQPFGHLATSSPTVYNSSAVTQYSTANIIRGCNATKNPILQFKVNITGGECTPNDVITQFVFNTAGDAGSTSPATDISIAEVYYTDTTQGFTDANFFGSVNSPSGTFTITGSQGLNLGNGPYYFYLAYTVPATATVGDMLDASMTSFVFNGTTITNMTTPSPVGGCSIVAGTCLDAGDAPSPVANIQTITAGSLIIPMDNTNQAIAGIFNLKAYGLVHALLMNDVPVKWIIKSGKAKDAPDFIANVTQVYPAAGAAATHTFIASEFAIDSFYLDHSFYSGGLTATQVITAFGNNVNVYKLTADVSVDVRYTLNHRPKIAVFSNGGNEAIQTTMLTNAGVTNYFVQDAGDFTGLASCYTFCSEAHWDYAKNPDTRPVQRVIDFVNEGGNFLAQCAGIDLYENHQPGGEHFQTTGGVAFSTTTTNTDYNPDMAFCQYQGQVTSEAGTIAGFWPVVGSSIYKPETFYGVSTPAASNTVIASAVHLTNPDSVGSNVFYLGGHQYVGATNNTENGVRMYLNATLIPAHRPTSFPIAMTSPTTCANQSITIGPVCASGANYIWTPTVGLSSTTTCNPVATLTATQVYSLIGFNGGCIMGPSTMTVHVNPTPVMTNTNSAAICSGGTVNIPLTSNLVSTYSWVAASNPNTTGQSITTQTTTTLNNTLINTTTSVQTVIYTVTPTSTLGSCIGTPQIVTVTVNPAPAMTSANTATICSGSSVNIPLTSNIAGSTFTWVAASNPNTTGESTTTQTTSTINDLISNSTTSVQAVIYTVTPSEGGCTGTSQTLTITVNPIPATPTVGSNSPLCVGSTLNLTASTIAGATYNWTGPNTFTSSVQNPTIAGATAAASGTYSVTATALGCTSIAGTINATVSPIPAAPSAGSNSPLCVGSTLNLTASNIAGATYNWTGPNTFTSSAQNPSIAGATAAATGTYSVTADVAGCTGPAGTVTVSVAPPPVAPTAGSNSPICVGSTLNLTASNVAGATYNWTGPNSFTSSVQNPNIAGATTAASGTYSVTATVAGCMGPIGTTTVLVSPIPAAPTAGSNSPICAGQTLNLTASTIAGATYSWTGPVSYTSSTQNPSIPATTTATSGTYSVNATVAGCAGPAGTVVVTVNPSPIAPTAGSNSPLCVGSTLNLTASNIASATYSWAGPNSYTSAIQNPSIAGTTTLTSGTYSVTAIVAGCPGAMGTVNVTVNPIPTAPTAGSNSPVCVGSTLNLTASNIAGATYNWTGPNMFTSATQNPSIPGATAAATGTYSVSATVAGCTSSTATVGVVVNPPPAAPTAGSNSPICAGSTLNLTASTIAGATYNWTGPNTFTSSVQNPSIANATTAAGGTYSVTATVPGCATSPVGTVTILVNPIPATPTAGSNSPICAGSTLNLTASTIAGATYNWTGPNTFTSSVQNPNIANATTTASGTYSVTATVAGCPSAIGTTAVTVNPIPATPTAGSNSPVCLSGTINLTASNIAGATYNWTGPNAFSSAIQNPSIAGATAAATGTYSVNAIVAGCTSSTATVAVVVNAPPAMPTAGSNSPICTGSTLNLTANTIASATYNWTGPNAFTSSVQNPNIANATTTASGTYSVTATVPGCATSPVGTVTVSVNPIPATPTAGSNSPLCVGSTLNLTSNTIAGATYSWTGPNTFTSSVQNPSITNATTTESGTYSVTATVAGCTSSNGTVSVTINPIPAAPTAGSNSPICQGTTLNLTASTIAGATYNWTGPNTFTSSAQNPSITNVTIAANGTYSVTAIVLGCISVAGITTVTINPTPAAPTAGSNSPICQGTTLNLTANNMAGASYNWTGPNTFTSSVQNPNIAGATVAASGIYSVMATVLGCVGPAGTTSVTVNPIPATPTAGSNAPLCVGQNLNLTCGTVAGATYNWAGPNTFTSSAQNPSIASVTTSEAGTYSVNVTVSGCTSPDGTINVIISPPPVAPTAGSNSPVCSGQALNLTASTIAGASYNWTGPNSFTSSVQNPSLANATTTESGTYTVTATIGICTSPQGTVAVLVNQTPAMPVVGSNSPLCVGSTLNLASNNIAGATYNWTGPNTFTSSVQNPSINNVTTAASGTYSITQTVAGCISPTGTVNVLVNPIPSAPTIGSNSPVCSGQTLNLTASNIVGATYNWTGPNTFTSSAQNPSINNITTAASGTYSVSVTVAGCPGTAGTTTVLVNPTPASPIAGSNSAICAGSTLNLTASNIAGASYNWAGPNTFTSSVQNPSILNTTTLASGTYSVNATVTGCTSPDGTVSVLVNPIPAIPTAGSNSPLCVSQNLNLTCGTVAGASYSWTGPNTFTSSTQNPSITNVNVTEAGTYSVEVTVSGCVSPTATVNVIISPPPSTPTLGSNSPICSGQTLNLTASNITGATYSWTGPNTFTSSVQNPSINNITTAGSGTYSVTATIGNCVSPVGTITVLVNQTPASPTAGSNSPLCVGSTLNLTASNIGGATYNWIGPNTFTSSVQNPSIINTSTVEAGTYTVDATVAGCTSPTGTVNIVINSPALVNAGASQTVCANNANVALNGTSSTGSGQWSSSGTGVFAPNSTALTATYTPSAADITAGDITLTLSSLNNGACVAVTDQMTITVTPSPTISAGSNQTVCANNANVTLNGTVSIASGISWASSGSGTFTPNNTTPNASYFPSAADVTAGSVTLTITSTGNGNCLQVSNSMVITITPQPVVNAGTDIFVCSNNPNATLNGTSSTGFAQWNSSGTGTFNPNNTTLNATYIPSATDISGGIVTLTLTSANNANCVAVSDTTTIKYTAPPTVNAGSGVSVCANNSSVILNGTSSTGSGVWSTSGTGTFTPNNNTLNATYNPSAADASAGNVTLTLTSANNGGCIPVTSQITLTITPGPTANAGSNQTVCANNANVILNGSFTISSGAVWSTTGTGTFSPTNTNMNTTYIPSNADTAAGSVHIILTTTGNGNCNATTDTMVVTITNAPSLSAGANANACLSNPDYTLNGTSSTGSGVWTTLGSGTFSPNNTTLNATYIPSTADTSAGTVTLVLTSANNGGCNAVTDTMKIVYTNIPTVNAGSNQTVCANNANVVLSGSSSTGTGIWSTSGTGTFTPNNTTLNGTYIPSAADTAAGNITLTIIATGGCSPVSQNILVTITHAPGVNAGANVTVCANNPNVVLNGTVSGATSTGIWNTSGTGTFNPNNTTLNATYIPSSADTTAGSVMLVLTSTGNGNCSAATDSMQITYTHAPHANAGSNVTVCANNAVVLNGAISGGSGDGIWTTTSGSGSFTPNNTTLNASYNAVNADTAVASVMLILTSTNNGGCLASSDTMFITVNPGPIVNAGGNQTVCANNSTISLNGSVAIATGGQWSSLGTGTFTPNNTTLNATYSPSAAEISSGSVTLILSSTGNGLCQAVTDTMKVNLIPPPIVNAGSEIFICNSGMSAALNGSIGGGTTTGVWTTLGSGTFTPNDSTLNATYNLSNADTTAGTVKLVLTSTNNSSCLAVTDTLKIKLNAAPIVFAGNDTTVCGNTNAISLNGSISGGIRGHWTTNGNGTFAPNDSTLNGTYTPGSTDISAGTVLLTLTSNANGHCPSAVDSMRIHFAPAIVVNAGTNISICHGIMSTSLNGSVAGGSTTGIWTTLGSGTFTPNDSTLNATYNLSTADTSAGNVALVLTSTHNDGCSAISDTVHITITNSTAITTAGNDTTVCSSVSSIQLNGNISGSSPTGIWSSIGAGTFTPNNTTLNASYQPSATDVSNGSVTLVLTSTGNCINPSDTIKITFAPTATVNAGVNQTVCSSNVINLNGSATTIAHWSTVGTGTFMPNDSTLNASYTPSITDNDTLQFVLTTKANSCGMVSDTVVIYRNGQPTASFFASNSCIGQTVNFADSSKANGGTINTWHWNFGTGDTSNVKNPTYTYTTSGTYSVSLVVSTGTSCKDSITKTININPVPVPSFTYSGNCMSDSVKFMDNSTITLGTINSWSWTFGDGGTSILENPNHLYGSVAAYSVMLTATSSFGCSASVTQTININPLPIAGFTTKATCGSLLVNFKDTSKVSSGTITSYNWTFGDGGTSTQQNPSHTYASSGTYTVLVQVQTSTGCSNTATVVINTGQAVLAQYTPAGGTYNVNQEIDFTNQSTGATTYTWSFGDNTPFSSATNPTHSFNPSGTYIVTLIATNNQGCSDTSKYEFTINSEGYTAATGFSPNGDGLNDYFYIRGGPFSQYELRVFNEWGQQIFMSNSQSDKWDGTFNGIPQPIGTYMYTFNGTLDSGNLKLSGGINIIR